MWRFFANAVRELSRTFADLFNPYRPELHYMRGPGPKCHAKSAGAANATSPELSDAAEARA
jgi:hypothetical protein